jgi:hypothetical protein
MIRIFVFHRSIEIAKNYNVTGRSVWYSGNDNYTHIDSNSFSEVSNMSK